jgi:hypothetical protein
VKSSPAPAADDDDDALSYFQRLAEEWFQNRLLIPKKSRKKFRQKIAK